MSTAFTVYKHTSPSGKVYIGITCLTPKKRWQNGRGYRNNPHFQAAIEKYGWESFKHEILAAGLTKEAAEEMEVKLIAQYSSSDQRFGYNIERGGSLPGRASEETRRKIGEANRCRIWSEDSRRKIGAASKGRKPTLETRLKMSQAHRGATHGEEAKNKIRAAKQKKVVCIETGRCYTSISEAAEDLGCSPSLIAGVCRGVHKTTHGLHFQFLQKEVVL